MYRIPQANMPTSSCKCHEELYNLRRKLWVIEEMDRIRNELRRLNSSKNFRDLICDRSMKPSSKRYSVTRIETPKRITTNYSPNAIGFDVDPLSTKRMLNLLKRIKKLSLSII
jgi:hypothetical protein